jgi:hypothetical protein
MQSVFSGGFRRCRDGSARADARRGQVLVRYRVLAAQAAGPPQSGSVTAQDLAGVLLHELGRVFNQVTKLGGSAIVYDSNPDGSADPAAEAQNASTVDKNCGSDLH